MKGGHGDLSVIFELYRFFRKRASKIWETTFLLQRMIYIIYGSANICLNERIVRPFTSAELICFWSLTVAAREIFYATLFLCFPPG
jgi:hypothetical protein